MEFLQMLAKETRPKKQVALVNDALTANFDLGISVLFKGSSRNKITPLFRDARFLREFWRSRLPSEYGWQIVSETPYAADFWRGYFRGPKIAVSFIAKGFQENPQLMVDNLNWYGGFLFDSHWESFLPHLTQVDNREFDYLVREIEFLRGIDSKRRMCLSKCDWRLKEASIAEILCAFTLFAEKVYFSFSSDFEFICYRATLFSLLEEVLNSKTKIYSKERIKWPTEKQLREELRLQVSRLSVGENSDLFDMLGKYEKHSQVQYLLQMYQWYNWGVDFDELPPVIRPKGKAWWTEWDNTESKYRLFHDYYHGFDLDDAEDAEKFASKAVNEISKEVWRRIYFGHRFLGDELGITEDIISKEQPVAMTKALSVLNQFSGCYESQYQHAMSAQKSAGSDYLSAIKNVAMGAGGNPRLPIELKSIHDILRIEQQSGTDVSIEEVKSIFHLGSANLEKKPICLDGRAFLKTPAGYFLLMRFFHPDIKTVLFNAVIRDNISNNKDYSVFQESKIAEIFKLGGWASQRSIELRDSSGRQTEIDAVAYKDGVLFLIEAKLTFLRTSIKEIKEHLPPLQKAGLQLQRFLSAFEGDFEKVAEKLGIKETLENLRIIPLIVSTSFEYDHHLFNGFRKVSLFELQLLLQGTTPHFSAWLQSKEIVLESLSPELSDKVKSGYATDGDWMALREVVGVLPLDEMLDKITKDGTMESLSGGASAHGIADAIETGAVWDHLLKEPEVSSEKLVQLTIDGEVVANYAA